MRYLTFKKLPELPGSPVVRALCFHCTGHRSPGQGTKMPHTMWLDQKKRKKKNQIAKLLPKSTDKDFQVPDILINEVSTVTTIVNV